MFAGVTNEDRMCLPRGLEGETRSRRSRRRVFMLLLSMGDDSMGKSCVGFQWKMAVRCNSVNDWNYLFCCNGVQ